jgi:hypothetical protein
MATVRKREWKPTKRLLTDEQRDRVLALPWEHGSGAALAREFKVSQTLISQIRNGVTYKRPEVTETYVAVVTSDTERYALGSFRTPEASQNAIDKFRAENQLSGGSIEKTKKGRYRARLKLGTHDTRWAAEAAIKNAKEKLSR